MDRKSLERRIVLWAALFGAAAAAVRGQDLDLAEVERRALASAPELTAARERVAALEARARGAGRLDDPMLEVELRDLLPDGGRPIESTVILRQPLPGLGRRGAQRAVAEAERAAAAAGLDAAARTLVGEIRGLWAEIWTAQAERALLEEAHPLVELVVESATARVAGGGESVRGVLEARLTLRRHEIEQEEVEARWLESQSRLSERAGFAERALFPRVGPLPDLSSPEIEIDRGAESSPRVAAARLRVELARAALEATRLERRPGGSLGVGAHNYEGEDAELVVTGGIELPIFRRARVASQIEAAEHELAAAAAELERERIAVRGELERLYLERVRIDRQLERVVNGLLPETSAAFEASRAALFDGSGSVAQASSILEMWIEARIDESRLIGERFATRAAIAALLADDADGGGEK